jgi:rod shape-determining protein MreD
VTLRTAVALLFAAVLVLILQTTVLPLFSFGNALPDLLIVFGVYLGLYVHSPGGAVMAFLIGYLEDALSGAVPGLNAFAMSLVFVAVYLTSRRLWVDNVISKIVLVFLASLLKAAAVVALVWLFLSADGLWRTVASYVLIEAGIAAVLSLPIFAALARVQPALPND